MESHGSNQQDFTKSQIHKYTNTKTQTYKYKNTNSNANINTLSIGGEEPRLKFHKNEQIKNKVSGNHFQCESINNKFSRMKTTVFKMYYTKKHWI